MKRCLLALLAALVLGATGPASAQNPPELSARYRGDGYFYPYPLLYRRLYREPGRADNPAPTRRADAERPPPSRRFCEEPAETLSRKKERTK